MKMFKTIREILRTGNATKQYPFAPLERPKDVRGKPEHDDVACIACAACAVACPPNAIQMETDLEAGTQTWSINFARCIFCGRCEEVCPTNAIVLGPEFELAVFNKEDLEETATYKLKACVQCGKYFDTEKHSEYAAHILAQYPDEPSSCMAKEMLDVCPECKLKADAYRAKRRDEVKGAYI